MPGRTPSPTPARQTEIYLAGARGVRPRVPVDAELLQQAAQRAMSREAFAYTAGGAGSESTMRANRAAFDRWRIVPRVLRDVSMRDTSIELFGRRLPYPLLLSPIGVLELMHRDADLAVARAAASLGVPMVLSNQASIPMETCAAAMGDAPRWFQLYWSRDDELVGSLVHRAERCGCDAIVVTLDTTLLGWRTRDLELGHLPGAVPGGTLRNLRSGDALAAVRRFIASYSRTSLTWDDLPFLRARTKLPIVLKGVLHPDHPRRAMDAGMNAVMVSNHGGRQVDGCIASMDALRAIVDVVAGRVPVLLDSGVRTGADVFRALALGASAVGIGRPYAFGLALAGEAGVREVVGNLLAELELTMALAGRATLADVARDALL